MSGFKRRLNIVLHFLLTDGYVWDWGLAAAMWLISVLVPVTLLDPKERLFDPDDPSLMYPQRNKSTVSRETLYLLVFLLPGGVFTAWQVFGKSLVDTFADWHHSLLSLCEGYALASSAKRWLNLVGRLRPDFLSRVASRDSDAIDGGRLSYPSGHACYIFMAMSLLTCYLLGKLRVFHFSGPGGFPKAVFCLSPLILAAYVAMTRAYDYRHDFSDINAGCAIGATCGVFAYFLNYGSLFAPDCHVPRFRPFYIKLRAGEYAEMADFSIDAMLTAADPRAHSRPTPATHPDSSMGFRAPPGDWQTVGHNDTHVTHHEGCESQIPSTQPQEPTASGA